MAMQMERQARSLANKIDGDPRSGGRYEAHGLSRDEQGWYVCVLDSFGTRAHPSGRDLALRSWGEWEEALTTG